jgi:hypothetical protein
MRFTLVPLVLAGCAAGAGPDSDRPVRAADHAGEGPLVIELFTSQGCSSCPPAEQLLTRLAHEGELAGRRLAPLAFHVDYWNDLGWADPFSVPAWTERQRAYASALGDRRVYTPELVVAGGEGMVGSQEQRVATAIAAAPAQRAITATAKWEPTRLTVTATAPGDADVFVAIWQDATQTAIARGENAGQTLTGDRVVRRLEHVAGPGQTAALALPLDPSWQVGAVAFAQRGDRRIVGATVLTR